MGMVTDITYIVTRETFRIDCQTGNGCD